MSGWSTTDGLNRVYRPALYEPNWYTNVDTTLTNIFNKVWRDNVINVKSDYGAAGDGTTDDTIAIQNALDAVNTSGGGTIYVPLVHRGFYGNPNEAVIRFL